MGMDRYETAEQNLNADRFERLQMARTKWDRLKLSYALKFFTLHPSPKPTIMNLLDFKREHPDFAVSTIPNLKGLRTQLKKKGLLLLPLILVLSGCASPQQKPGLASFGTRAGNTINHEIALAADLASVHLSSMALLSLATPFGTLFFLPLTFRPPAK